MPASPSWQTWRLTYLSTAQSILGYGARPRVSRVSKDFRFTIPCQRHLTRAECDARDKQNAARKEKIRSLKEAAYPRYARDRNTFKPLRGFSDTFAYLEKGKQESDQQVSIEGRISSIRKGGSSLAFIDVSDGVNQVQIVLSFRRFEEVGLDKSAFKEALQVLKTDDVIAVVGHPYRTEAGEMSIKASRLPHLLTPCLHSSQNGHADLPSSQELQWGGVRRSRDGPHEGLWYATLLKRSVIIKSMRAFLEKRDFIEVQTPILEATAGGAIARAFETRATEFPERKLNLRIAPELWLKRLVIGGMHKVFEIGPSFRNEGLDNTHNPEFTTCEFYEAYASLPQLLSTTEEMLPTIAEKLGQVAQDYHFPLENGNAEAPSSFFVGPYEQLDFIPALNSALGVELPNLASPIAKEELVEIFSQKQITLPPNDPSLPRLLDKLSSTFLEPKCIKPTWIINIPECLSPLSKSFIHPTAPNNQPVAARAELFVNGSELINCYEEENSPFEQRRKFIMQHHYAAGTWPDDVDSGSSIKLDESYLSALEWGLPPTGGWGCGIDRLVMLYTQEEKIGNVLSFGNLRRVTRGAEKWDE